MTLTVADLKDLIVFGREQGLLALQVGDMTASYGVKPVAFVEPKEDEKPVNDDDLSRFSAIGRKAMAK